MSGTSVEVSGVALKSPPIGAKFVFPTLRSGMTRKTPPIRLPDDPLGIGVALSDHARNQDNTIQQVTP